MRKLMLSLVLGWLSVTSCLAQEAVAKPVLLPLVRVMDAWMDISILMRLAPLKLTDAQLQALAAVYQQCPFSAPDLKLATEAADKAEALRRQLLAGEDVKPGDMEAFGKIMQEAFKQFGDNGMQDQTPVTELTPTEKLVWAVLTPDQQKALVEQGGQHAAGASALGLLKRLRGVDEAEWVTTRDRLAELLAAQAGGEGTPARANAKQMFLDFLNRVRGMTEADFAAKQKELEAEAAALVPAGANLTAVLIEFDPTPIHQTLVQTLLNPRMPALVEGMQAARKKPAGG